MPRSYISGLFSSSPISPLQQHMAKVQATVTELLPFFKAALNEDWEQAESQQQLIATRENEADALKRELRLKLPRGLFMPVSRRDLLEVLTMQDRIANKAKDISGLMLGRQMRFPDIMHAPLLDFVDRCTDATAQAQTAINELDELVATGFGGNEIDLVESMIHKLDIIESDTDDIQVAVRAVLFKMEKDLPPVDVMFMYRILDWIGDLADLAQRVGSRLELMLAR